MLFLGVDSQFIVRVESLAALACRQGLVAQAPWILPAIYAIVIDLIAGLYLVSRSVYNLAPPLLEPFPTGARPVISVMAASRRPARTSSSSLSTSSYLEKVSKASFAHWRL